MHFKSMTMRTVFAFTSVSLVANESLAGTSGGSVVYSPAGAAQAVPALSGTMLISLGLLLAVIAYRALRSMGGGQPLAALVASAVLGLASLTSGNLIQDAVAVGPTMSNPEGGTVFAGGGESAILNTSGVDLRIDDVVPAEFYTVATPVGEPQCAAGLVVPDGSDCKVNFID